MIPVYDRWMISSKVSQMRMIPGFLKKSPTGAQHLIWRLLERLIEAGKSVNVGVMVEKDADSAAASISKIAAEKSAEWGDQKLVVAWDHPLVKRLALAACLRPLDIPVYFADKEPVTADRQEGFRKHAEGAFIGITAADYCIAETATLTMKTRPGQPRCVSLLPSIHIAVIRLEQILSNLNELYTLLKWNPVGAGRRHYPLHDLYHRSQQNGGYRGHPRPWGPRPPGAVYYSPDRVIPCMILFSSSVYSGVRAPRSFMLNSTSFSQ